MILSLSIAGAIFIACATACEDSIAGIIPSVLERYSKALSELSKQSGIIGAIYTKAQNKIDEPAKLKKLFSLTFCPQIKTKILSTIES